MNHRWRCLAALACLHFVSSARIWADVRLPSIISDRMVLQKDLPIPIWGWAFPGEEIEVTLGDISVDTAADPLGRWEVALPPITSAGGPHEMKVTGINEITIKDILIGEVWIGAGQSNMQWPVGHVRNSQEEISNARFPKIRLFVVPPVSSGTPADNVPGRWVECSPETVVSSSSVLYFFGREIHRQLDVPMGLVTAAWGGTRIQPWISPEGYNAVPELVGEKNEMLTKLGEYSDQLAKHAASVRAYIELTKKMKPGDIPPRVPLDLPDHPFHSDHEPTGIYNGMIHPLIPFAVRGVLWYQGESNIGAGMHYHDLQRGLFEGWRAAWNQEQNRDFTILFAQLAPFNYLGDPTRLPRFWEAQTATLDVENTGMVVLTDLATLNDIHPPNKQEVGRRLSLWALAKTYGRTNLTYSGPLYKSMAVEGNKIVISFHHATGLKSRDGRALSWWSIAGSDKIFIKAKATIDGDKVIVVGEGLQSPVAVRFGWHQLAEPNLINDAGLPASPFRTDYWTDAVNLNP